MDTCFDAYNLHRTQPGQFTSLDHHLQALAAQPYQYENPLIQSLPRDIPGIYTIGGGRQIGKTTLLKQWMAALIEEGVPADAIVFLTGELIEDHHALVEILHNHTKNQPEGRRIYIIIDEITYVKDWDKGIKFSADAFSIDSYKTVSDYCELLSTMDALFIQRALVEDKLVGAPKKARKITFTDPFIYHAIKQWIDPVAEPSERIQKDVSDPMVSSDLVEAIVSNHYSRHYPTYYIKASGEIDVAYVKDKKFWPIEVKWRNQIRPKDIKQLSKYKHCEIYAKAWERGSISSIPIIPLPLGLLSLPDEF